MIGSFTMLREKLLLAFVAVFCSLVSQAQTAPDTYWVQFTDKTNTPYSLDAPEQFLSARAIARRQAQGIALDELDLPVDPAYITGVLATGDVQLVNRSKWFNAITIRTSDTDALLAIQQLPFVQQLRSTQQLHGTPVSPDKFALPMTPTERGGGSGDYGASFTQIAMLNGHELHAMNAQGQGMLIGVLDSGFDQANTINAFDELRNREGIVLTRDMVNHDGDVYADHWHGRSVLSCLAAVMPGYLIGTAPAADYVLVRTEEAATEYIVEEDNWVAGAELCDSLGCDVLNTSLGYTRFDDPAQDHAYADMNGLTARISIASGIAAMKGMVPVNSAGNSGQSEWYYISAPADAINILAVGAVGDQEQAAPFSSRGPSADGRVKPDVMAMGWGAIGLDAAGEFVVPISGTSFSSPILAGLVACLWQLHPGRTATEIMDAVRRSASLWTAPNDSMGYGIPDFMQAHLFLDATTSISEEANNARMKVQPVPFADRLEVLLPAAVQGAWTAEVVDAAGRVQWRTSGRDAGSERIVLTGLRALDSGVYVLRISSGHTMHAAHVVKE
ncbi:MAG: S8 family serine peptidase [Flavobacteriales bacterium]|nr:S8 family serine peptidase [Flavobacteriales bacterium]